MMSASNETFQAMDQIINRVERLHTSPHVACQVVSVLQNEDFDIQELVKCLESDPALASSVLKLVNSSYFGVARNIGSLQQAVTFLGSRSLRLAVLSFGLLKHLHQDTPGDVYRSFWRRSLTMASASSVLARCREIREDLAYSAGLLADVGSLLLAQIETETYVELLNEHDHTPALINAEIETFGFHHAQIGARLLTRWNLPDPLVSAVTKHYDRPEDEESLEFVLWTADLLADALWTPGSDRANLARQVLEQSFDFDLDGYINLAMDCKKLVGENAEMFHVDLQDEIDCDKILECARRTFMETALEAALDMDSVASLADFHD